MTFTTRDKSSGYQTPEGIDSPPSYDTATREVNSSKAAAHPHDHGKKDQEVQPPAPTGAGPSMGPMVHHYVNPETGHRIATVMPPDHPEMICLQEGQHVTETRFGLLGILAAVFWFPFGVGLCLLDRRVRCTRCGQIIDGGLSC